MRVTLACIAFVTACVATASAQESPLVQPGDKVRVTYGCVAFSTNCPRAIGTLVEIGQESMSLDIGSTTAVYSISSIDRLEVVRGQRANTIAGALLGVASGAAGGVLVAAFVQQDENLDPSGESDPPIGTAAAIGAGVGVLLGAAVGTLVTSDVWEEVPLEQLRVSVGPRIDGRLGLSLSVTF